MSEPRPPVHACLLLLVLLLAAGCGGLQAQYVAADRATYDAVAPVYSAYVLADPALDGDARERRLRLVRSWAARLAEGEARPEVSDR